MTSSPWLPVDHGDRYHGQVRTTDGRSLWVLPRLHRAAGWCTEVRLDDPEGELIERAWSDDRLGSELIVEVRRRAFARGSAEAAIAAATERGVAPPPADRGVLVVHITQMNVPLRRAQIDGGPHDWPCFVRWVAPASYAITWETLSDVIARQVIGAPPRAARVEPAGVVHVHPWPVARVLAGDRWAVPPWHRCAASGLHWTDGGLASRRDLRGATRLHGRRLDPEDLTSAAQRPQAGQR